MTYRDSERKRAIENRDRIFGDPGGGSYQGIAREFVLREASKNLWGNIREKAIDYFNTNDIAWWGGTKREPTGHLLSSQVACINHLFPLRDRKDLATGVLQAIDPEVETATVVDDGYGEFEFIGNGHHRPLKEKGFTRGANCTSVDAVMIGEKKSGERCMYLIEWKYTELYPVTDKYIDERKIVYDHHIAAPGSPFVSIDVIPPQAYYFEPFYQLMRQTLLGWLLTNNQDHGCTQYRHIHVVPEKNRDLSENVTSPMLKAYGRTLTEVWRSVLKKPDHFTSTTPEKLLTPIKEADGTDELVAYLQQRYWMD